MGFFIFDSLQFLSNVRGRKFLDKMLGSENAKKIAKNTLQLIEPICKLDEAEFIKVDSGVPGMVDMLGYDPTNTTYALSNVLMMRINIRPASQDRRKVIPSHTLNCAVVYSLVAGVVTIAYELDGVVKVSTLSHINPIIIPAGVNHCVIVSWQATFIITVFSKKPSTSWNSDAAILLKNRHLEG